MTFAARLQQNGSVNRRTSARRKISLDSSLEGTRQDVSIHDLSSTGMLMETAARLALFDDLEIELPHAGVAHAVVVWNNGRFIGCELNEQLSKGGISAALLRSSPAKSPQLDLLLAVASDALESNFTDEGRHDVELEAPFEVRARVILGSAIVHWALIIWAIASLIELIGDYLS